MSNATEAVQFYHLLTKKLTKKGYTTTLENLASCTEGVWTTAFSISPDTKEPCDKRVDISYSARFTGNHGCVALIQQIYFDVEPRNRTPHDGAEEKRLLDEHITSALNSLSQLIKDSDGMTLPYLLADLFHDCMGYAGVSSEKDRNR